MGHGTLKLGRGPLKIGVHGSCTWWILEKLKKNINNNNTCQDPAGFKKRGTRPGGTLEALTINTLFALDISIYVHVHYTPFYWIADSTVEPLPWFGNFSSGSKDLRDHPTITCHDVMMVMGATHLPLLPRKSAALYC